MLLLFSVYREELLVFPFCEGLELEDVAELFDALALEEDVAELVDALALEEDATGLFDALALAEAAAELFDALALEEDAVLLESFSALLAPFA